MEADVDETDGISDFVLSIGGSGHQKGVIHNVASGLIPGASMYRVGRRWRLACRRVLHRLCKGDATLLELTDFPFLDCVIVQIQWFSGFRMAMISRAFAQAEACGSGDL